MSASPGRRTGVGCEGRRRSSGVSWGMRRKVISLGWLKGGSPARCTPLLVTIITRASRSGFRGGVSVGGPISAMGSGGRPVILPISSANRIGMAPPRQTFGLPVRFRGAMAASYPTTPCPRLPVRLAVYPGVDEHGVQAEVVRPEIADARLRRDVDVLADEGHGDRVRDQLFLKLVVEVD